MHHSYIVRVYRHEKNNPRMLVGLVEEVGVEGRRGFTNYDELWGILNPVRSEGGGVRGRDKKTDGKEEKQRK